MWGGGSGGLEAWEKVRRSAAGGSRRWGEGTWFCTVSEYEGTWK